MFENIKLKIELVPDSCWFSNVRSNVSKKDWDIIRKATYEKYNYCCGVCGKTGLTRPEAHEVFSYNIETKVQKLEKIISLDLKCHQCKHFGFWQMQGKETELLNHLMEINKWTLEEAKKYVEFCFKEWYDRGLIDWTLDLSLLEDEFGIFINK